MFERLQILIGELKEMQEGYAENGWSTDMAQSEGIKLAIDAIEEEFYPELNGHVPLDVLFKSSQHADAMEYYNEIGE